MWYHKLFPNVPFLIKASRMKVSNLTKLSVVLRSDLKPDWNRDIWLLDSKNQVSLLFIILSSVLHRQLVKAIGL